MLLPRHTTAVFSRCSSQRIKLDFLLQNTRILVLLRVDDVPEDGLGFASCLRHYIRVNSSHDGQYS